MQIVEYHLPNLDYDTLKALEPTNDSYVSVFNKTSNQYEDKMIYRKYKSYGISPTFKETNKSFMFNCQSLEIPKELEPYLQFAQSMDKGYNNCYVNWYDSGENYIEPHSDCNDQLVHNSMIIIINLNEGQYERSFKIQHKDDCGDIKEIKLKHGHCLMFNSAEQTHYRHWVDKEDTKEGRISVTLRMIK